MKSIRTAAILMCILCAIFCRAASGEPVSKTAAVAPERPVAADSASVATAPHYKEAEPVLRATARERSRPTMNLYTPQRGIRLLVDVLLVMVAAFTVFSFWGMRKSAPDENDDSPKARKRRPSNRTPAESSASNPEPRSARARPPQSARERAELLKTRRSQIAAEIDRLMKRV